LQESGGVLIYPRALAPAALIAIKPGCRPRLMQYRPALIEGFLASTRLDFSPFGNPTMKHRVSELLGYHGR
jgi:hypothetical protein